MPVEMYGVTPQFDALNLGQPDDEKVIWPKPHDAKIDVAWALKLGLKYLELDDVPVNEDGIFLESQLKNENDESVPVITIIRTADMTMRNALGNYQGNFIGQDNALVDPCGIIPEGKEVNIFAEWSKVSIDVTISDLIGWRANQMYLIVKYIMMTAQPDFHAIGYLDLKRTNGVDQTQVAPDTVGSGIIFTRTLTYELQHPDFVASLPTLVMLVKQSLTIPPIGPNPAPVVTTDV